MSHLILKLRHTITKCCGTLELQRLRRREHLFFKLRDVLFGDVDRLFVFADGLVRLTMGPHFRFNAASNVLLDRLGRNSVFAIVIFLQRTTATCLVDRRFHRISHLVRVENDTCVDVPRGTTDRLDQRGFAPQEAFFVGIQNRDQRNLRQIQSFPQQVHSDKRLKSPLPKFLQQLHPFERIQLTVKPLTGHPFLREVRG